MIKLIKTNNFSKLYKDIYKLIKHNGTYIDSTQEVFNVIATIDGTFDSVVVADKLKINLLHVDQTDKSEFLEIRKNLTEVFHEFKISNDTRRGTFCHLYEDKKYLPRCISLLHFYYREKQLNLNVYFRSSDIRRLQYDLYTINELLIHACKMLSLKIGYINIFWGSMHEYLSNGR